MTVKELIAELQKMPQDARVIGISDGYTAGGMNVVYATKKPGFVVVTGYNQPVFDPKARPKGTSDNAQEDWRTTKDPNPKGYTIEDDFDMW